MSPQIEDPLKEYLDRIVEEVSQYIREHTTIANPVVTITIKDKKKSDFTP